MPVNDQEFMRQALAEAARGEGRTAPNPCVGALVVRDGRVVGRGYHQRAGTPHAEVHALRRAGELARGATLYVTLEPCHHTGRTPPCSLAVARAGISRVVIGMEDPNPLACGGADYLRNQKIEVVTGVCREECRRLNRPFLKRVSTGMPWVVMKAGLSLDGRITYRSGQGEAITGPGSRALVHAMRNRLDAILIGVETARIDDPSLTTRMDNGQGRDPVRVVLDSRLRLAPDARLLRQDSPAPTLVFCRHDADPDRESRLCAAGAVVIRVGEDGNGRVDLVEVLQALADLGINSVLVEGGSRVHGGFLARDLVDEVCLFLAPFFIGESGVPLLRGYAVSGPGKCRCLQGLSVRTVERDLLIRGEFPDRLPAPSFAPVGSPS